MLKEGRGIWFWRNTVEKLGINKIVSLCDQNHLNILLPEVPWISGSQGDSKYWEEKMVPIIEEAHKKNMKVHPWVFALNAASVDDNEDLMQIDATGKDLSKYSGSSPIACPANPLTRTKNVEKIVEMVKTYNIDGIHLEDCFVYHPSVWGNTPDVCYCNYCKEHAPIGEGSWRQWRCNQLTNLLAEIHTAIKKAKPEVKLSVAARVPYVSHSLLMSADWKRWCELEFLDFLIPMCYRKKNEDFLKVTKETKNLVSVTGSTPMYAGIGVSWSGKEITPDQLTEQIGIARSLGYEGICFFHLGGLNEGHWQKVGQAFSQLAQPIFIK